VSVSGASASASAGAGAGDGDSDEDCEPVKRRRMNGRSWRSEVESLTVDSIESLRLIVGFGGPASYVSGGQFGRGVYGYDEDIECGKSRYEMWAMQNPLPDAIDFITGEVIRVPALSPDGYVLDYRTWIESLSEKAVNPFTQTHLTKRQLVILTTENIAEYADKIVNLKEN
jgi:hypothetical protein